MDIAYRMILFKEFPCVCLRYCRTYSFPTTITTLYNFPLSPFSFLGIESIWFSEMAYKLNVLKIIFAEMRKLVFMTDRNGRNSWAFESHLRTESARELARIPLLAYISHNVPSAISQMLLVGSRVIA